VPTRSDRLAAATPAIIGAAATTIAGPAIAATTASLAPGLSIGGLFVAPLVIPGLFSKLFPSDPVSMFGGAESILPFGVDLSIFGGPFKGRVNPFRPKLRLQNPFSFARPIDLPKLTQLAVAAAAEFSFTPEQAELGSQFLRDAEPEEPRRASRSPLLIPLIPLSEFQRGLAARGIDPGEAFSASQLVSDIEKVRRQQRERVFNEPVFGAIMQAQARGLIPGAVPSPKFLEGIQVERAERGLPAPQAPVQQQPAVQLVLIDEGGERHTLLEARF